MDFPVIIMASPSIHGALLPQWKILDLSRVLHIREESLLGKRCGLELGELFQKPLYSHNVGGRDRRMVNVTE